MKKADARLYQSFQQRYVAVIDLDGVVYEGDLPIAGAVEAIAKIRSMGKRVVFLTNNSGKSRESIARKLRSFGVPCQPGDVMSSARAAAVFLAGMKRCQPVRVFGSSELVSEIQGAGVAVAAQGEKYQSLLVGLDSQFSMSRIAEALQAIKMGARWYACNRDPSYVGAAGEYLPGTGPLVAAIEAASGVSPDEVLGKPATWILECLMREHGVARKDCCVFGDSWQSDIALACAAGIPAVWISLRETGSIKGKILPVNVARAQSLAAAVELVYTAPTSRSRKMAA